MALNSNALTTTAAVKAYLGISVSTYDTFFETQINVYSNLIEKYCNRVFGTATYTDELYKGYNTATLQLRNYPVTVLTTIELNDSELSTDDYELIRGVGLTNTGKIHKNTIWWANGTRSNISENLDYKDYNIKVTYTAGYVLPASVDPVPNLPSEISQACIDMVAYRLSTRNTIQGIKSEKLITGSITYGDNQVSSKSGLLPSVEGYLSAYKRVVL